MVVLCTDKSRSRNFVPPGGNDYVIFPWGAYRRKLFINFSIEEKGVKFNSFLRLYRFLYRLRAVQDEELRQSCRAQS